MDKRRHVAGPPLAHLAEYADLAGSAKPFLTIGEAKGVSRETAQRLDTYATLALKWNNRIGLVSPTSATAFWSRHVEDCLQLAPLIPPAANQGADIGSGAGLPGLVLAIATDIPFLLIEADQRKAAFLREAVRVTSARARVVAQRAERVDSPVDVLTSRATASLATLLAWSARLIHPATTCLFMKGRHIADELRDAEAHWSMHVDILPSATDRASNVVRLRHIERRTL